MPESNGSTSAEMYYRNAMTTYGVMNRALSDAIMLIVPHLPATEQQKIADAFAGHTTAREVLDQAYLALIRQIVTNEQKLISEWIEELRVHIQQLEVSIADIDQGARLRDQKLDHIIDLLTTAKEVTV